MLIKYIRMRIFYTRKTIRTVSTNILAENAHQKITYSNAIEKLNTVKH